MHLNLNKLWGNSFFSTISSTYAQNFFCNKSSYHLSDFKDWEQKPHAKQWLIFPHNISSKLSIDETALSKGELYTIITNKKAKGKKGSIVTIFYGTKVELIISQLLKVPASQRGRVKVITLDIANSMKTIARKCFPKAIQVTDRFHVQKLTLEVLQDIRIKHRWDAIDTENEQIKQAKLKQKRDHSQMLWRK